MIVTEEDAKKKWCPFALALDQSQEAAVNRMDGTPDPDCFCIASRCMAWRWSGHQVERRTSNKPVEGWDHVPAEDSDNDVEFWVEPFADAAKRRRGHCGMAGMPPYA